VSEAPAVFVAWDPERGHSVAVRLGGLFVGAVGSLYRRAPQSVPWGEIAGIEGGADTYLDVRRHRADTVRTSVALAPGHFTRLQAKLRQHGVEAVFA